MSGDSRRLSVTDQETEAVRVDCLLKPPPLDALVPIAGIMCKCCVMWVLQDLTCAPGSGALIAVMAPDP